MQTLIKPDRSLHVVRAQVTRRPEGAIALDIDNNITDSDPTFHGLEAEHDKKTAERIGLPYEVFLEVRKGDIRDRRDPFDLAYTIAYVCEVTGADWTVERCLEETKAFLADIEEREHELKLYRGVATALPKIRSRHQQYSLISVTDCPLWLAVYRLELQGVLPHLDAVVGLKDCIPAVLRKSKYLPVVLWAREWIQAKLNSRANDHLEAMIGVPQILAKPHEAGPLAVLQHGIYDQGARFVMFDDKPCKGGALRDNLQAHGFNASFVHTRIGKHDEVTADGPQADGEIFSDFEESLSVLEHLL